MATRNLTVSLDDTAAVWVRREARRLGKSVSQLVGEMLKERMEGKRGLKSDGRYLDRSEANDRARLC